MIANPWLFELQSACLDLDMLALLFWMSLEGKYYEKPTFLVHLWNYLGMRVPQTQTVC